ncbi:MAG: galactokinase [Thermoleophilaceae bacterium]
MAEATGWAPGRVNLIGEHTDYNRGFVLPFALSRGVRVEIERADSLAVGGADVDERTPAYVGAVCLALGLRDNIAVRVHTDLAPGAGLGSSAALQVATARALRSLYGLAVSDVRLALSCHAAESRIVGVRCGVMDQFASAVAQPHRGLFIDCRSLAFSQARLPTTVELAVLDSGVRHANADGAYNERRAECERAAQLLGVESLRDLGPQPTIPAPDYDALPDPLGRRVRHVYEENIRVAEALVALETGNVAELVRVVRASHASQRDLFEVSVPEVDELVEAAQDAGALAARLTGGGFGGAVVALCAVGDGANVAEQVGAPLLATVD